MVQIGQRVPFLLGMPSIEAVVIGNNGRQYILQQDYDTQQSNGEWIHVTNTYYRDCYFIDAYWADTLRLSSQGDDNDSA